MCKYVTQGRNHRKSKTGASVAPHKKDLCPPKIFKKNKNNIECGKDKRKYSLARLLGVNAPLHVVGRDTDLALEDTDLALGDTDLALGDTDIALGDTDLALGDVPEE